MKIEKEKKKSKKRREGNKNEWEDSRRKFCYKGNTHIKEYLLRINYFRKTPIPLLISQKFIIHYIIALRNG